MYSTITRIATQAIPTIIASKVESKVEEVQSKSIQTNVIGFIDNIKQETLKQTVATQKQLNDFNERCEQVITNIKALNQDSYQIIDLLILQLMAVAEYTIQGTKLGEYRQQTVFEQIQKFFNNTLTTNEKVLVLQLIEQIFKGNKKQLLDIFEDMFSIANGCGLFSSCTAF
ncbi:Conserved_hypothetical protein [Hexamita inflata]|uniref:Uncharacterized protein n=1 Tax=Hexamita inflata TaxID=28002 RepID=A0AA86R764_9EUKA|nr:Conserved hypothetical protein [Hexamita inflata]CAI9948000.1 Conserved hypothetical protein [Hexamita inflata]CAI9963110.1 Conserved hypothetical protein [Hexamita inflata]